MPVDIIRDGLTLVLAVVNDVLDGLLVLLVFFAADVVHFGVHLGLALHFRVNGVDLLGGGVDGVVVCGFFVVHLNLVTETIIII